MSRINGNGKARKLKCMMHELESLRRQHRSLDEEVAKLAKDPLADPVEVTAMKKRKLKLKEEIMKLENEVAEQEEIIEVKVETREAEVPSTSPATPSGKGGIVHDF